MKHLKIFSSMEEFEAAKPSMDTPFVVLSGNDVVYSNLVEIDESDLDTTEYVDLGLPSGLKWAKCNVGAASETDYGKYFQWGDTVGYTDASHSTPETAPFNNGSNEYDETYFTSVSGDVCPNGVLAKEYDAASVNMGGSWRMPTKAEFEELIGNTTVTWENDFNGSGVTGRKFTSTKEGYTDKYIFIPAAGLVYYDSIDGQDSYGGVWSSSLNTDCNPYAWYLNIDSEDMTIYSNNFCSLSVRGVCA